MFERDKSRFWVRVLLSLVLLAVLFGVGQGNVQADREAAEVMLVFEDNGAGISEEDLPNIFNRFWRKDKSRDRKDGGGHGLGLAIVKQLVAAHGGSVEVSSTLGEGTRFSLHFPINQDFADHQNPRM